jgi:hypothetical protein
MAAIGPAAEQIADRHANLLAPPGEFMSPSSLAWLRRSFDATCSILGLMLIVLLGPWMLVHAITDPTPQPTDLVQLSGITQRCRPVLGGLRVSLQGHANEFRVLLDSCASSDASLTQASHVTVNVVPEELRRASSHSTIRTFGLEVRGNVVRSMAEDIRISKIDRCIMAATGVTGTAALLLIIWILAKRQGSFKSLLTGEPGDF